ncbi:hypothetical protein [Ekhidna sp.]|uniref:hypothetical protein n=1 Tax=Ekhidna sp. TaxID=2608089 RepID=UPI00329734BB
MKTTRKIIKYAFLLLLSVSFTYGQSIDEERMERDLKIAENILSTLSNGDNRLRLYDNVESNYIPGYGVVFSLPQSSFVFATTVSGQAVYSSGGSGSTYVIASSPTADGEEEIATADVKGKELKADQIAKESEEKTREQMTTFLVDYADLIGQLKPSDRIVVQLRGRNDRIFYSGKKALKSQDGMSAQILKSDLISYKQGKMDRDDVIKKITFTLKDEGEASKDLELFATIFSRLYEPDLSDTYYIASRSIGYTKLEGFGITFSMKVYSSSSDGGFHTIKTTGESGLTQEERNQRIVEMYPKFEKSFKENLLDYGRTIKSLKSDEMLIFKVKLTECRGCDMPQEIEVSVSGKTLQSYDKGSLSKENGLKQVSVKKK